MPIPWLRDFARGAEWSTSPRGHSNNPTLGVGGPLEGQDPRTSVCRVFGLEAVRTNSAGWLAACHFDVGRGGTATSFQLIARLEQYG